MPKFFSIVCVLFIIASCTSQPTMYQLEQETTLQYDRSNVRRAFVFLLLDIDVEICAYKNDVELSCQRGHATKSASGFVVDKTDTHIDVITAAHFCDNHKGTIERDETAKGIRFHAKGESRLTIKDYAANTFTNDIITIIAQDTNDDIDICLLRINEPILELDIAPVVLASRPPVWGDYIFHVGAPMGVYKQASPMIFLGTFAGKPNDRDIYVVSSFTMPGSSGGMLINARGRLVGMVHEYIVAIKPHGGHAATLKNIRHFICANVKQQRQHIFNCKN